MKLLQSHRLSVVGMRSWGWWLWVDVAGSCLHDLVYIESSVSCPVWRKCHSFRFCVEIFRL